MDDALWTFSATDFLPHVRADHPLATQTPIILSDNDNAALPHYQILINLTSNTPAHFSRFSRVFEIISKNQEEAQAGRVRYAFYRQHGYPLTHFVAEQN
jgi:DNA polymerase III subunit chi